MWQVAVPMTSNPKAVQNGQHASPVSFAFGSENFLGRGQSK